jgi:recombinational DNA repair protein RecR
MHGFFKKHERLILQPMSSSNVSIEELLSSLGKATRRGVRKCPRCGETTAQFFSHFFVGCFESSRQTSLVKYNIGLSAALEAADKSVGCFQSSPQKNG